MRHMTLLIGLVASGWLAWQSMVPAAETESAVGGATGIPAEALLVDDSELALSQRVLLAEARGDLESRSRLLSEIRQADELDALGQSILGNLRDRRDWKSVEASIEGISQLPALQRYERIRSEQPDSVLGHSRLAMWCRQAGLEVQQAAHWRHVLQLNPNHTLARMALGHRLVNGRWVSPDDVAQRRQQAVALRESMDRFGQKLIKLRSDLASSRPAQRQVAVERLDAIKDAEAIPAVATLFAAAPPPVQEQAIRWLGYMSDPAAADVLATWSVEQPSADSRFLCAQALARKPYEHYVPQLLERLRTPMLSATMPTFRPDGSLASVRQVFAREAKDNYEVMVASLVNAQQRYFVRGTLRPPRTLEETLLRQNMQIWNALNEMRVRTVAMRTATQNQRVAAIENLTTEVVNDRVKAVLAQAAGTDADAELPVLWDWWEDYTERRVMLKPSSYASSINLARSQVYAPAAPAPRSSCECFVAGTPVITARGEKPIESLIVGDQVLSKDVQTGQLTWDAVVTTTEQPAQSLVTVQTDQDQFRCTGGHLFWVSGKGWTKARDLADGDLLHGLRHPAVVSSVAESAAEPTYNLITGRHHNYFVGEGHVLSHDFAEQTPTAVRVPGLDAAL